MEEYEINTSDIENVMESYVERYLKQFETLPPTFENCCRICFMPIDDGSFVDLNTNIPQHWNHTLQSYAEMLWKASGKVFAGDDNLPTKICKHCAKDIIKSYCLIRKIEYTQRLIDNIVQKSDIETTEKSKTASDASNTDCGISMQILKNFDNCTSFSENDIIDLDAICKKTFPAAHSKSENDKFLAACASCIKYVDDDHVQLEQYYMSEKQRIFDISNHCERKLQKRIQNAIENAVGVVNTNEDIAAKNMHAEKVIEKDKTETGAAAKNVMEDAPAENIQNDKILEMEKSVKE